MTIQDFLEYPFLYHAKLLAGSRGCDNEITFCMPSSELLSKHWIMPGALLVHTNSNTEPSLPELAEYAHQFQPAGIVLMGELLLEKKDFDFFDQNSIPLIHIAQCHSALNFIRQCASVLCMDMNRERYNELWLSELCLGAPGAYDKIIPEQLGYHSEYNYHCLLIKLKQADQLTPFIRDRELKQAVNILRSMLSTSETAVLYFQDGERTVTFIPALKVESGLKIQEKIKAAVHYMRQQMKNRKWIINVGTAADSIGQFRESYCNALHTETVTLSLHVHEEVNFFQQWYVHTLITAYPISKLTEIMHYMLEPILEKKELLETLIDYLTFGENQKITSEHMYIHVNTLRYRLQQISELLECDLKDPNTRFRLRFAVILYRYLQDIHFPH